MTRTTTSNHSKRWTGRAGYRSVFLAAFATCVQLLACHVTSSTAIAQVHSQYRADMEPGAIGRQQLARGGPRAGYYQPVELYGDGLQISVADGQGFATPSVGSIKVGLLIGHAYRFQVSGLRNREQVQLYPTVEVIDRLYPPEGKRERYPIPIELTQEDLALALNNRLVTRVIYLETPQSAVPERESQTAGQRYFEVLPSDDPLQVADVLGRPMVILKIGSRTPTADGLDDGFLLGSPPVEHLMASTTAPAAPPTASRGTEPYIAPITHLSHPQGQSATTFMPAPSRITLPNRAAARRY
ncbi:MAG: hypothetical protein R3E01_28715 [Pirellulaceae bacterium]|nr:hypothetical protein [Planctomycetales bacterium]